MSDERLRELERRHREEGTVEAEAAWLAARLRAGDVAWDDVALDAYLGHAPAQVALGEPPAPVVFADEDAPPTPSRWGRGALAPEPVGFTLWLRGFAAWGRDVLSRALLAQARCLLAATDDAGTHLFELRAAIDAWCRAPSDEAARAVERCAARAGQQSDVAAEAPWTYWPEEVLRDLASSARPDPLLVRAGGHPVRASRLRAALRSWPLAPRLEVPLPPGPTVRERVERAVTPPATQELVKVVRAAGPDVIVTLRDGSSIELEVDDVTYDWLYPTLDERDPTLYEPIPLADVVRLEPAERAPGERFATPSWP